jgi:hypothetical protein
VIFPGVQPATSPPDPPFSEFKNNGPCEVHSRKLKQEVAPIDITLSRRKVLIVLAVIVAGVHHP